MRPAVRGERRIIAIPRGIGLLHRWRGVLRAVVWTRFQQEDRDTGVCGVTGRQGGAGGPRSNDDVVVAPVVVLRLRHKRLSCVIARTVCGARTAAPLMHMSCYPENVTLVGFAGRVTPCSWPRAAPRIWPAGGGQCPGRAGSRFPLGRAGPLPGPTARPLAPDASRPR